jgi:NDP-sugar pyrophosphorylase family protein
MLRLFEEKDGEAVILGTRVPKDAANNFGCIVSDSHTKRVLHYVEKPESYISNLINCGVYLFATEAIFPSIKSAIKRRADRPRLVSYPSSDALDSAYLPRAAQDDDDDGEISEVIRLEQDILSDLADSRQFYVLETKDFWRQIKTAGSAVPANALYLMKAFQQQSEELAKPSATILPPVFIHPTAQVDPTAKLGPNVSIGPRAVIGAGARIKEAIVLEDAEIKHDACVLYAIIGWSSRVGAWARVEGTPTPVRELSTSVVKNGVKVQSITILGKECAVADEVRVQNCVCLPYKELKRVSCCESFLDMTKCANRCDRTCKTKSSCKRTPDVSRNFVKLVHEALAVKQLTQRPLDLGSIPLEKIPTVASAAEKLAGCLLESRSSSSTDKPKTKQKAKKHVITPNIIKCQAFNQSSRFSIQLNGRPTAGIVSMVIYFHGNTDGLRVCQG